MEYTIRIDKQWGIVRVTIIRGEESVTVELTIEELQQVRLLEILSIS